MAKTRSGQVSEASSGFSAFGIFVLKKVLEMQRKAASIPAVVMTHLATMKHIVCVCCYHSNLNGSLEMHTLSLSGRVFGKVTPLYPAAVCSQSATGGTVTDGRPSCVTVPQCPCSPMPMGRLCLELIQFLAKAKANRKPAW